MSKREVTMKDTKQVIFDKLQEVQDELNSAKAVTYDPREEKKTVEKKETLKKAESIVSLNILNYDIMDKYNALNKAIEIKESELNDLYAIDAKVTEIAALIETKKQIGNDLEEEHKNRVKDLEEKYNSLNNQLQEKLNKTEKEIENFKEIQDKERQREKEEFEYNRDRERKIENDKWEDEKAQREADLTAKEKEYENKKEELREKLETIFTLEEKVAEIPTLIEDAKTEAAAKAKADLEKIHAIKETSRKKEVELDMKLLEAERDNLKESCDKKDAEIEELKAKLESAQGRVETIATTAVNAARPMIANSDK